MYGLWCGVVCKMQQTIMYTKQCAYDLRLIMQQRNKVALKVSKVNSFPRWKSCIAVSSDPHTWDHTSFVAHILCIWLLIVLLLLFLFAAYIFRRGCACSIIIIILENRKLNYCWIFIIQEMCAIRRIPVVITQLT